jgi:hypothetical protein
VLGVWDSQAEIITSKIDVEGIDEVEEVVKVSTSKEEEVYVIK